MLSHKKSLFNNCIFCHLYGQVTKCSGHCFTFYRHSAMKSYMDIYLNTFSYCAGFYDRIYYHELQIVFIFGSSTHIFVKVVYYENCRKTIVIQTLFLNAIIYSWFFSILVYYNELQIECTCASSSMIYFGNNRLFTLIVLK